MDDQIPEITSKEMYSEALKLFNVEIRKSGRGHIVVVTDDFGNPIVYYRGAITTAQGSNEEGEKEQITDLMEDIKKLLKE